MAAGCGGDDDVSPGGPRIVTTTNILGDVAFNVAGRDAVVQVLLPQGADPHDYQASSQQVAWLEQADLVVANGLDLEEGLADVLDNAESDGANVLWVGDEVEPLSFDDGRPDPHIWFDPLRMADAARLIADELAAIDGSVDWKASAETYVQALLAADQEAQETLAPVMAEQRRLVTNHDSLRYFAARYDFVVIGTVIPGGSTLADPSSSALAELVRRLEQEDVSAIFAESTERTDLAAAIADEASRPIEVVELHTGSLGEPGSGAETLIGMWRTNARLIADALAGTTE